MTALLEDDFLWRRFHSLMGVVPLGMFLAEHFWTNSHALNGAKAYEGAVQTIQDFPLLILFELGIFVPLFFHAIYGFYRIYKGRNNVAAYPYARNWGYTLQRWTGTLVFLFVIYHLYQFRFGVGWHFKDVRETLMQPMMLSLYVTCTLATIYHFANGMWNFCINWGLTVGPTAQRLSAYAWTGVGLAMTIFSMGSLRGFLS